MKTLIMTAAIALVTLGAHAAEPECTVPKAFSGAMLQSINRQSADGKRMQAATQKLLALQRKAQGPGPIGPQLSPDEGRQFSALADEMMLMRLRIAVESARERDIDALQRMQAIAGRNWFQHEYVLDESNQPDYFLQVALGALQNSYATGTVAMPGGAKSPCTVRSALGGTQDYIKTIASGNGAHALSENASGYLVAVELVKKMNDVSEMVYKLDMTDTVKASQGKADIAKIMGESVDAAIASGLVSSETADMINVWRRIDEHFPSEAERQVLTENPPNTQ